MTPDAFRHALILTGPTGSGKSDLGIALAERLGAEVVCMDSMTLYRGMDIGTAKPGPDERRRVPHHLLDALDPWESASVAWWLEHAAACCRDIEQRGRRALFVGGTPLYLKALLHGLFDGPPADPALRRRLSDEAERLGSSALHDRLSQVDPISSARLHPNDLRRIIRALEVWELTGRPISDWQRQWSGVRSQESEVRGQKSEVRGQVQGSSQAPDARLLNPGLWLDVPRAELYARIDARVHRMVEGGLVDEVRALRELPQPLSREARQALGYKEMFDYIEGQATLDETIIRIQTRTRNFAKRQLTWFRHLPECRAVSRELTFAAWGLTMM